MPAPDVANGSPTVTDRPAWQKWALIAGVAIVLYVVYTRYKANAANAAAVTPGASGAGASAPSTNPIQGLVPGGTITDPNSGTSLSTFQLDPNTGIPINPATGNDFGSNNLSQLGNPADSMGAWITKAYQTAIGLGAPPGYTNKALYDYTNGNQLDVTETGIINQIEQAIGLPPGNILPFNGTYPTPVMVTPGPPIVPQPPPPPNGFPGPTPLNLGPLNAVQRFVNNVYANIRAGTVKTPANETIAEDYVKTGAAYLPLGFNAPTGYTLNPSTRILTRTPTTKVA